MLLLRLKRTLNIYKTQKLKQKMSGALLYNIYQKQDDSVMSSYSGMRHRITSTEHYQAYTQTPTRSLVTFTCNQNIITK